MGIPSFYKRLIQTIKGIVTPLQLEGRPTILGFDANCAIYDCVASLSKRIPYTKDIQIMWEAELIQTTILYFETVIKNVNPSEGVWIAFDGVAPVAKLDQQRSRRYKSNYQNNISKSIFKDYKLDKWNTAAITPGTFFMNQLNAKIKNHFNNPSKYSVEKIILSLTDQYGEGEHKIFDFIRSQNEFHKNTSTVIYGLDADLIMLCMNHLSISKQIYLFRETPHFIKNISNELEPNENYILNIPELARFICLDMKDNIISNDIIYDYIFMCFFLGNDFMPHFPSINIRTGGVLKMMNAYKATLGNNNENLYDSVRQKIIWKNVRKLVIYLSDLEEENFKQEIKLRDKREKNSFFKENLPEEILKKFDSIPTLERTIEKFINPFKDNWETRYYKSLFFIEIDDNTKKEICINYLEGLEWTMKYYTIGCPDWRWRYKFYYPPLLKDLLHYIPCFDKEFIDSKSLPSFRIKPVSELVQLCYVLPKQSLPLLLPKNVYEKLLKLKPHWYDTDCEFLWAYCKYFWESHVLLPEININELEILVSKN
jgi:5'-3' exonuclease